MERFRPQPTLMSVFRGQWPEYYLQDMVKYEPPPPTIITGTSVGRSPFFVAISVVDKILRLQIRGFNWTWRTQELK